jgi:DNA modification methylase
MAIDIESTKNTVICGDVLSVLPTLPAESIQTCVTSPPYFGLRNYGVEGQIGLEKTPEEYVDKLVLVFREVRRVLRDDGTLWLNLGDSYLGGGRGIKRVGKQGSNKGTIDMPRSVSIEGLKPKNLLGIPWRVAFALQSDGWILRQDIVWHKPNPMPESVTDRCTRSHEYIFLLSKSPKYYYDHDAIMEEATGYDGRSDTMMKGSDKYLSASIPGTSGGKGVHSRAHERWPNTRLMPPIGGKKHVTGNDNQTYSGNTPQWKPFRNKRSVWRVPTKPYKDAHFATFPPKLIEPCILAGCPEGGIVLDPFMGSGTVAEVAMKWGRDYIGIELNPEYANELTRKRIENESSKFALFNID